MNHPNPAAPQPVPEEVMRALDRMSTPIDASWRGVGQGSYTAAADARDMKTIRDYVMRPVAAPHFPTMLRKMWSGSEVQDWIYRNWPSAPAVTLHAEVLAIVEELMKPDPQADSDMGRLLVRLAQAADAYEKAVYPIGGA